MKAVIETLRQAGAVVRGRTVRCPFHDDKHASGWIKQTRRGIWLYVCYACDWNDGKNWGGVKALARKLGCSVPASPIGLSTPAASPSMRDYSSIAVDSARLSTLASALGLQAKSLAAFGGRAFNGGVLFPMHDSQRRITGWQIRKPDGTKLCTKGSKPGLFLHDWAGGLPAPAYAGGQAGEFVIVTEGLSDAAYVHGIGLDAVGRYSATQPPGDLVELVKRSERRTWVIVADRDRAGIGGATMTANALRSVCRTKRFTCPAKDIRAWAPDLESLLLRAKAAR